MLALPSPREEHVAFCIICEGTSHTLWSQVTLYIYIYIYTHTRMLKAWVSYNLDQDFINIF
jgi:hypothetical protein